MSMWTRARSFRDASATHECHGEREHTDEDVSFWNTMTTNGRRTMMMMMMMMLLGYDYDYDYDYDVSTTGFKNAWEVVGSRLLILCNAARVIAQLCRFQKCHSLGDA